MKGDLGYSLVTYMISTIKELKNILENKIKGCDLVVITPHKGVDCDAIASALAVVLVAKKLGKESVIVINETSDKLDTSVSSIIDELPSDIIFVNTDKLNSIINDKNALLVTVDTNKKELIPVDNTSVFKDIIVIDHHQIGDTTIDTKNKYINVDSSSASEIMFRVLEEFKIRYDSSVKGTELNFNMANYLLAGISLDTAKFTKNISSYTMRLVSNLMNRGADINYVNNLFMDDFESDKLVLDLVRATTWRMFNIAIAFNNEDPYFIYDKEALAKAADFLMKYKSVDAAFALGLISDNVVHISGRSKGNVDIGEIMSQLGGGGNKTAGAARIENCNDVKEIKLKLDEVIKPGYKFKGIN
jgi:c-di-AMP phosphodiesterase-like protein